jgi:hypothetical protein
MIAKHIQVHSNSEQSHEISMPAHDFGSHGGSASSPSTPRNPKSRIITTESAAKRVAKDDEHQWQRTIAERALLQTVLPRANELCIPTSVCKILRKDVILLLGQMAVRPGHIY